MSRPSLRTDHESWWCHLSRDEFDEEVAKRLKHWRAERIGLLDTIGARLNRDDWEPRKPPPRGSA